MGYSKIDFRLTDTWVDLTALDAYSDIADVEISLYAKYVNPCYVFVGSAEAPSDFDEGVLLSKGDKLTSTAGHWWVKGSGKISILVESGDPSELTALTLSDYEVVSGDSGTINIIGATVGSTITGSVPEGMTLNSGSRTITGAITGHGVYTFTLTETLSGHANSPRVSNLTITSI
jgi:hypothetical protein